MSIRNSDSCQNRCEMDGKLLQRLTSAERTRYAARGDLSGLIWAHNAPERLKFVKDLVLEVPRFPLTCRDALFSASSPVAGAALLGLTRLRCRLLSQDSEFFPRPQATSMPLADEVSYIKPKHDAQPLQRFFLYNFQPEVLEAA
jgi:hypothetical protein